MPEPTVRSFTPDFNNEIDIESIITAPLVAASKANVVMATGQQRFLLDYCFTLNEEDKTYEPILIKMVMVKSIIDHTKQEGDPDYINEVRLVFSVPLLCIVPFSSLAVEKVKITFDLELTSAISAETTLSKEGKMIDKKAFLKGRISSSSDREFSSSSDRELDASGKRNYKSQKSSTIKVSLNAGTLPLSTGFLYILDLYTKAIQPSLTEAKTT
jgi:Protein of unknown function (DUF2589)